MHGTSAKHAVVEPTRVDGCAVFAANEQAWPTRVCRYRTSGCGNGRWPGEAVGEAVGEATRAAIMPAACTPQTAVDFDYEACLPWCPNNLEENCWRCKCRACAICRLPSPTTSSASSSRSRTASSCSSSGWRSSGAPRSSGCSRGRRATGWRRGTERPRARYDCLCHQAGSVARVPHSLAYLPRLHTVVLSTSCCGPSLLICMLRVRVV